MNFLNPAVLFGLLAASIPLILHLLHLRKLKTIEFSSLRFLKELQKTKIRRLKLKQILLLILRTLIIVFAVMAFARPTVKSSLPLVGTYAKTSTVILIDNSFSMDVSDEFGNRFNQAKNSALSILNTMKEGDEAVILPIAGGSQNINKSLSRNKTQLKDELSNVKISNISANLDNNLRVASTLLNESFNINKEIYIISDAQPNVFFKEIKDSLKILDANTTVFMIPVAMNSKSEIQNISIDSLNMNTKILQKNKLVEIETYVKNHTDKNISGLVVSLFFNGDRVAQRTVDFQAGQTKSLVIAAEPKDFGFYSAYVEIENDALEQDNKRFFGFFIPEKPNIAIIGSQDKSQFISLALSTKTSNENFVNYKAYTPNQINEIDLNSYEMLICAGGPYRESDFNRFLNYIKNGNSILMFADDKTDFNLFKRSMIQFNFGDLLMQEFKKEKPAGFVSVDKFHPIFEGVFKGTTDNKAIVESPKIFRLMATNSGQKIISTANGGFLNESKINDGKILFCGVSPDIEWSTFPITGMFPALLYRSVFYLSSRENLGMNITVGKTVNITLPKRFASGGNFIITDPKNNVSYRQAVMLPSGATISLDNLNILGVYSIKTAENKIAGIISVNPDPSESAVQQLKNDEIKSLIKERINNNSKLEIINPNNVTQNLQRARTGTELWQLFIILALISAITEMMIARASKKEKEG